MDLGDFLYDLINEIKENKDIYETNKKKLDIILNVMNILKREVDMSYWVDNVVSKEDKKRIELLYQEINEKANTINELFNKLSFDCKNNYEWNTKLEKFVKKEK